MRIEVLDDAERDLLDGFGFYERQQAGLGTYFLDSLIADIDSLILYAGLHERHFGYHRLLAKRFPYAIYYRVADPVVRVYAILDCRQSPTRIRTRLR